ncbi:KLTH0E05522p [Lachancea thermotolerans CBS 6340]|uniref:KLTH0E05522p n=1 Tax=Lachancea thermotolerans (strain ATCC 56472 / CBS 6340 / NRRL Y-8284) TaxID=559295 RepID=C5DHM3_LACTC|nr:KLTH0E05522p [Lachancea thermotolerans CBS 6340]CAR23284.1 KLTH0E05522p [Lachancea thermotolerans CBS 6340]
MRFPIVRFQPTLGRSALVQQKFKDSMARMGGQAMILTSAGKKALPHDLFRGVTLSSVSSLSLKPQPLLQFNLQLPSFTSESLHMHEYFALHLLKPDANSITLARAFSKGAMKNHENGEVVPTQPFKELTESVHYRTYGLSNSDLAVPILINSERVFVCRKKEVFRVGDHEIWVGMVDDIIEGDDVNQDVSGGLLYCNRKFHKLGGRIE